jgi:hypothetical protein
LRIFVYSAVRSSHGVGVSLKKNRASFLRSAISSGSPAELCAFSGVRGVGRTKNPGGFSPAMKRALVEKVCGIWFHSNPPSHRPRRPTLRRYSWSFRPHARPPSSMKKFSSAVRSRSPSDSRKKPSWMSRYSWNLACSFFDGSLGRKRRPASMPPSSTHPPSGVWARAGSATSVATNTTRIRPARSIALIMPS